MKSLIDSSLRFRYNNNQNKVYMSGVSRGYSRVMGAETPVLGSGFLSSWYLLKILLY